MGMNFKIFSGQAPVAHICNPGYSESRDQKDCGLEASPDK
jgi:hypothetical protein